MRLLHLSFLLLLPVLTEAANFARVNDPDGFVNIRVAPGTKSKVMMTARQSECVETFGSDTGWTHVAYTKENSTTSGYIRSSRLVKKPACNNSKGVEAVYGKCAYGIILLEETHSIPELRKWFTKFSSCKDTDAHEQVSSLLASLLSKKWNSNMMDLSGYKSDVPFLNFVLSHVDSYWNKAELESVASPDKSCDVVKSAQFCLQLKNKAKKSLGK